MNISIPFFGMNKISVVPEPTNKIKYLLVAFAQGDAGSKTIFKFDLDGNEIASNTHSALGGNAAWRPRVIFSERDDDDFYYSCGDGSTARITKFNKDLTVSLQSSNIANSPDIIVAGKDMPIFHSTTQVYSFRSKTALNTLTGSVGTTTGGRKSWFRISDIGVSPPNLAWITPGDGMRVLTTNSGVTSYVTTWTNSGSNYDSTCFLYNKSTGEAVISNSGGGSYFADVFSSTRTSLSNFKSSLRFASFFSNGDVLFYDSGNIRRRTWSNVIGNSTTNVFSISLSDVVWMDIDDDDNFYVVTSSTTDNVRKYTSNNVLVWRLSPLPGLAGTGGGLAHK